MGGAGLSLLRGTGAALLLLALAACAAGPAAAGPRLRAVAPQPGDGVTINDSTGDIVVDITSEKGIGKLEFIRGGAPPKSLTFNLHLGGLEEFQFGWDAAGVTGHVSSSDGAAREEVTMAGGQAAAIDETSQYWMPVGIEAGSPRIPLKNGYFALVAPEAFIKDQPTRFALQWIDFYR